MKYKKKSSLILFYFLLIGFTLSAQTIKLSRLFSNGMVLQRLTEVPVWGTAPAGTDITITGSWNNIPVKTVANQDGKFMAYLNTPEASYTAYTLTVNTLTITDVLVGEVWLCSGQSNMQLALSETTMGTVVNDNNPYIRGFQAPAVSSTVPIDTLADAAFWRFGVIANNMGKFSAVGYYFARRLQLALNIPIGMLCAAKGSTGAEEWMNSTSYNALPVSAKNAYTTATATPSVYYNGTLYPMIPYKISGIIWYQGEGNVARQQTYSTVLPAMVNGWRTDFKDAMLPFYFVQLPSFQTDWMEMREIQQGIAETLPNAGFVTTIDVGELTQIHPINKKPVGDRLGDMALARIYGKETTFNSPQFKKSKVEGKYMRVLFNFAEKGLKINAGAYPQHFEIAGADLVYYPALARIEGNSVVVWADEVTNPVKVRYFWKAFAVPNLFSADDYPVSPFRMK
jgi:sialate O-acetylesterase